MINPHEAIVAWLAEALTGAEGRVAGKHRYGDFSGSWTEDQTGVAVHLDGGTPDIYTPISTPRFEIRIYSNDQEQIEVIWMELIVLSRKTKRFAINTSRGTALIHYFLPDTVVSLTYDEILQKDLGVVFFSAMVSEEAVSSEET